MPFVAPSQPPFDVAEWGTRPYPERVRVMCQAWAMQGFGAPGMAYLFYAAKLLLYVGGFVAFAANTAGLGGLGHIGSWWATPIAFEKAVVWSLLYESLGLGCASGPLTGRYLPPLTAVAHWLRPGTTRLAPFSWVPLTSGVRRSLVDVALFVAFVALAVRALVGSAMTIGVILPVVIVLCVLGLRDKTVFLAARSEHYLIATFVFLFPHDVLAGSKAVQLAIWWGAASSKLNRHFPSVIAVMMSNNPFNRSKRVRRALYRHYPDDLRVSKLGGLMAHGATVVEYGFPLLLVLSKGGLPTDIGLGILVAFHLNILLSFPMGVPLEWNVFFIYSGLTLFGEHAGVRLWAIHSPLLAVVLVAMLIAVPVLGNLRPDKISFLSSMRYYAGNWAASAWLWRPGLFDSLDDKVVKAAKSPRKQLERLYGAGAYEVVLGRVQAFRSMHIHGRALNWLLPRALSGLDDAAVIDKGVDAFEVVDGELVAGVVLGWNFGDGHLHDESLLHALQEQCSFAPGELRCVFLESQPAGRRSMHWRVADAATGLVEEGHVTVEDLESRQPWGAVTTTVDVDSVRPVATA